MLRRRQREALRPPRARKASFAEAGLDFAELGGVQANPTAEFSAYTARFARENGCDMLLAVGGGSVIDSAKMAAYCVHTDFEPWGRHH